MRLNQLLIDQSRRATENEENSDLAGVGDEEFLQYLNDGQDGLQSMIAQVHADVFLVETILDVTSGVESYDIPTDALLGNRVSLVEYSDTGQTRDYYPLRQGRLSERISGLSSTPSFYIRRSGKILLQPLPQSSSAKLRVTYAQKLPRLDLRRATVGAVTLDSGTSTITSLTLDTAQAIDRDGILIEDRITIVGSDGTIKMKNIPITDINASSGVVTLGSFTYESGEMIAVGDYVCRGPRSTTHSSLPDLCERYLIEYMNWNVMNRDSSQDALQSEKKLLAIGQDIIEFYKEPDNDIDFVPILDSTFLDTETD